MGTDGKWRNTTVPAICHGVILIRCPHPDVTNDKPPIHVKSITIREQLTAKSKEADDE